MPATVHCIRHGQGLHNLNGGTYTLLDPDLTPAGIQQCKDVLDPPSPLPPSSQLALIVASPLRRTLHTAHLISSSVLPSQTECTSSPKILALADLQETSSDRCDIGSDVATLHTLIAEREWHIDLSLVPDDWNIKTPGSRYGPSSAAIKTRARAARILIRQKVRELMAGGHQEPQIVVVTHGSFLHFFTDDWEDADRNPGTGWQNCEVRSYTFEDESTVAHSGGNGEARLTETIVSRQRRGKTGPMPGREEQMKLFAVAMEKWEGQGLERPDRM